MEAEKAKSVDPAKIDDPAKSDDPVVRVAYMLFNRIDKDNDNTVDVEELKKVLKTAGETDDFLDEVDANDDGSISFEEYLAQVRRMKIPAYRAQRNFRKCFKEIDTSGKDSVTKDTILACLSKLQVQEKEVEAVKGIMNALEPPYDVDDFSAALMEYVKTHPEANYLGKKTK